jgi:YidC/Oxa1 family membrane protein insertase
MLYYWQGMLPFGLTNETGFLGPYLNVLPLVTTALFLVHQKLFTPPATDEQTRMQMQMMKFMTLFIGVLFFKVASGLCLYFIASSLWSVAERKLLPKSQKQAQANAAEPKKSVVTAKRAAPARAGSNGNPKRPAQRKRQKRR